MVHLRVGEYIMDPNSCHVVVFPQSNTVNLVDWGGDALVANPSPAVGSAIILNNGRCSVDVSKVALNRHTVETQGRIWVTVPITPMGEFRGQKFVYVNVFDTAGLLTHWITANSWMIQ
jgi:hypothetical protein